MSFRPAAANSRWSSLLRYPHCLPCTFWGPVIPGWRVLSLTFEIDALFPFGCRIARPAATGRGRLRGSLESLLLRAQHILFRQIECHLQLGHADRSRPYPR